MVEQNAVPRRNVTLAEVSRLADRLGWKPDKQFNKRAQRYDSDEYAWRAGRNDRVVLAQNQPMEHDYFVVDASEPTEILRALHDTFPCYTDQEILHALRSAMTTEQQIDGFHLLGARAFQTFDQSIADAIAQGIAATDSQVRLAAAVAASGLRWRQLRPLIERMSREDPSELLRTVAGNFTHLLSWDRG